MNPADAKMLTRFPCLDFGLGETLDMLRETVQNFAAGEIAPRAAEIDHSNAFPMDLWRKLGDLGLLGITVEEEYGGADGNPVVTLTTVRTVVAFLEEAEFVTTRLGSYSRRANPFAAGEIGSGYLSRARAEPLLVELLEGVFGV